MTKSELQQFLVSIEDEWVSNKYSLSGTGRRDDLTGDLGLSGWLEANSSSPDSLAAESGLRVLGVTEA